MSDEQRAFGILGLFHNNMKSHLQLSMTALQGALATAASPQMTDFAKIVTQITVAADAVRVTTKGVEAVEGAVVVADAVEATEMTNTVAASRSKQACSKKNSLNL